MATVRELGKLKEKIAKIKEGLSDNYFPVNPAAPVDANRIQIRRTLKGHFSKVYAVQWAGMGSDNIVSCSQDGKMIVWNANTTHKLTAISMRSCWVMTAAYERQNNTHVACAGLENEVCIYRTNLDGFDDLNGIRDPDLLLKGHNGYVSCFRFIDGRTGITAAGDSKVGYWDLERQVSTHFMDEHTQDVMSVAVSPMDRNLIISGSVDHKAKLWDVRTSRAQGQVAPREGGLREYFDMGEDGDLQGTAIPSKMDFEGHESDVNSVTWFPDGNAFATASDDSSCQMFDIRCFQQVNAFRTDRQLTSISSVDFSRSGRVLFAAFDAGYVVAWDVLRNPRNGLSSQNDPLNMFETSRQRMTFVETHTGGQALAAASWDTNIYCYA